MVGWIISTIIIVFLISILINDKIKEIQNRRRKT